MFLLICPLRATDGANMFVIGAFSIVEVLKFHPKETHFHISMVKYIGKLPSVYSTPVLS